MAKTLLQLDEETRYQLAGIAEAGEMGTCLFLFSGECTAGELQPEDEGTAE